MSFFASYRLPMAKIDRGRNAGEHEHKLAISLFLMRIIPYLDTD